MEATGGGDTRHAVSAYSLASDDKGVLQQDCMVMGSVLKDPRTATDLKDISVFAVEQVGTAPMVKVCLERYRKERNTHDLYFLGSNVNTSTGRVATERGNTHHTLSIGVGGRTNFLPYWNEGLDLQVGDVVGFLVVHRVGVPSEAYAWSLRPTLWCPANLCVDGEPATFKPLFLSLCIAAVKCKILVPFDKDKPAKINICSVGKVYHCMPQNKDSVITALKPSASVDLRRSQIRTNVVLNMKQATFMSNEPRTPVDMTVLAPVRLAALWNTTASEMRKTRRDYFSSDSATPFIDLSKSWKPSTDPKMKTKKEVKKEDTDTPVASEEDSSSDTGDSQTMSVSSESTAKSESQDGTASSVHEFENTESIDLLARIFDEIDTELIPHKNYITDLEDLKLQNDAYSDEIDEKIRLIDWCNADFEKKDVNETGFRSCEQMCKTYKALCAFVEQYNGDNIEVLVDNFYNYAVMFKNADNTTRYSDAVRHYHRFIVEAKEEEEEEEEEEEHSQLSDAEDAETPPANAVSGLFSASAAPAFVDSTPSLLKAVSDMNAVSKGVNVALPEDSDDDDGSGTSDKIKLNRNRILDMLPATLKAIFKRNYTKYLHDLPTVSQIDASTQFIQRVVDGSQVVETLDKATFGGILEIADMRLKLSGLVRCVSTTRAVSKSKDVASMITWWAWHDKVLADTVRPKIMTHVVDARIDISALKKKFESFPFAFQSSANLKDWRTSMVASMYWLRVFRALKCEKYICSPFYAQVILDDEPISTLWQSLLKPYNADSTDFKFINPYGQCTDSLQRIYGVLCDGNATLDKQATTCIDAVKAIGALVDAYSDAPTNTVVVLMRDISGCVIRHVVGGALDTRVHVDNALLNAISVRTALAKLAALVNSCKLFSKIEDDVMIPSIEKGRGYLSRIIDSSQKEVGFTRIMIHRYLHAANGVCSRMIAACGEFADAFEYGVLRSIAPLLATVYVRVALNDHRVLLQWKGENSVYPTLLNTYTKIDESSLFEGVSCDIIDRAFHKYLNVHATNLPKSTRQQTCVQILTLLTTWKTEFEAANTISGICEFRNRIHNSQKLIGDDITMYERDTSNVSAVPAREMFRTLVAEYNKIDAFYKQLYGSYTLNNISDLVREDHVGDFLLDVPKLQGAIATMNAARSSLREIKTDLDKQAGAVVDDVLRARIALAYNKYVSVVDTSKTLAVKLDVASGAGAQQKDVQRAAADAQVSAIKCHDYSVIRKQIKYTDAVNTNGYAVILCADKFAKVWAYRGFMMDTDGDFYVFKSEDGKFIVINNYKFHELAIFDATLKRFLSDDSGDTTSSFEVRTAIYQSVTDVYLVSGMDITDVLSKLEIYLGLAAETASSEKSADTASLSTDTKSKSSKQLKK